MRAALYSCFYVAMAAAPAHAQNQQCRTAPVGTSTANCASEAFVTNSVAAGGDVRGPDSSTAGHVATFADTTGKLIQDGGALGTVSSAQVSAGVGVAVSGTCTITTTGNCTVAAHLADLTTSLGSDVSLNSTGSFFDGPSVAQGTSGKWHASGTVTLQGAGSDTFNCKLWDGSTVIASTRVTQGTSANAVATASLSGNLSSPAANIKISCQDVSSTSGLIRFNVSGGSKDSTLTVFRIQ
jgi:hypothetical protein